jgi:cytochrome c
MKFLVVGMTSVAALSLFVSVGFAQGISLDSLASADIAKGEQVFKKCKACHSIDKDGKKRVGPNLYSIVDRPVAQTEGFKFSKALTTFGGTWTLDRLDMFLENPRGTIKGTKMAFAGLKKPSDRLNLIAYLNAQSDATEEVASSTEPSTSETPTAEDTPEFGILFSAPGVEQTFYTCTACHSERIVAQQGLTRAHWDEVLVWMVEEQEMDEIEEPDRSVILDYLAAHYGEDRPNFPKPGQ